MKYTTYTTIETEDGKYKLSALLNDDLEYCMTALEVPQEVCSTTLWDNDRYIIKSVLPFLKKKYDKIESDDDSYKRIPKDRRKEVKQIIKQGIKLGFFKNEL